MEIKHSLGNNTTCVALVAYQRSLRTTKIRKILSAAAARRLAPRNTARQRELGLRITMSACSQLKRVRDLRPLCRDFYME